MEALPQTSYPAGIGEWMAGYAAIAMAGGELKLLNPGNRVKDALRTTRIDRLLKTHTSTKYPRFGASPRHNSPRSVSRPDASLQASCAR